MWTLAALFLWATLAPAFSRTLDHGTPLAQRGWVPVCSARDMSWVPAAQGQGNGGMAPASLLHHLDACSLCVLATDRGTPPPSFEGWGLWAFAHPPCPVWGGQALPAAPACAPCARGDTVFEAGQAARLWRVVSGVLSLVQRDHGAQHLMSLALPGDLLGIEALCQGLHTLPHQLRTGPVLPRVAALLKVLGHAAALVGQPSDADRLRESLPPLRELALVVDAKAETVCRALAQLLPPRSRKSGPRGWAAAAASASARAAAQALGLAPTPPIGGALA